MIGAAIRAKNLTTLRRDQSCVQSIVAMPNMNDVHIASIDLNLLTSLVSRAALRNREDDVSYGAAHDRNVATASGSAFAPSHGAKTDRALSQSPRSRAARATRMAASFPWNERGYAAR
jgi:hypothetical protein